MANLTITAPSQGIAQSPHVGYENVVGMDIYSIPGIVQLNNVLAKRSTTAVTATIKWIVRDPVTVTKAYAVDSSGDVYVGTLTTGTWSWVDLGTQPTAGGAGQGLAIWKDYLFCARATAVDLYGPLSGTPAWRNSWAGLTMTTDSLWHPMLVSKLDGHLYIGEGRYIAKLKETSGDNFDWSDNTSWNNGSVAQALTLPEDYRVKCLAEQGNNLMIGTWKGTNIYDFRIADIFPWDGNASTFGQPIQLNENGINAMINKDGFLYVLAGLEGNIYKSNGTSAVVIGKIPESVCDVTNGKYIEPYPGSICIYKGKLLFGVSGDGTSTTIGGCGIYSLMETSRGNILTCEHLISTGSDGSASIVTIGALLPTARDEILVGWRDASVYGVDQTNKASFGTAATYVSYFDTPLYEVGDKNNLHKFQDMMINLVKDMTTNDSIRIQYRVNLTDTPITLETYTYTNFNNQSPPDLISYFVNEFIEEKIPACQYIQFRVYLCGTTTSPQLKKIIF